MCEAVKHPLLLGTPYEKDGSLSRKCYGGPSLLITKSANTVIWQSFEERFCHTWRLQIFRVCNSNIIGILYNFLCLFMGTCYGKKKSCLTHTKLHIHVLYMYYTCSIHVLYIYYTCTIHVLYIYYTCIIHVHNPIQE
jgi:hypothetical protein